MKSRISDIAIVVMLALVISMQGLLLYRQNANTTATKTMPTQPEPKTLKVDLTELNDSPSKGDPNAPITLIEFSEYQCPFCAKHATQTYKQLQDEYVAQGKIRYVFVDFPLPSHGRAIPAANAGRCALDQGRFWEMHDVLFASNNRLELADLLGYAKQLDLKTDRFSDCINGKEYESVLQTKVAKAKEYGIQATPSFLLGTGPESQIEIEYLIRGAQPFSVFQEAIQKMLSSPRIAANRTTKR